MSHAAIRTTEMGTSPASELLDAVCTRDFDRAEGCLSDAAHLRALLPTRVLEVDGPTEIVGWFRRWFEHATTFSVLHRDETTLAGRDRLTWRFEVAPHPGTGGPTPHVIEQTLFCDVQGGRVARLDLLCSGFRPV